MQPQYERLSHCKWECKYHVVFIPKYRKKVLYGHIRVGQILKQLISQKEGVELNSSCCKRSQTGRSPLPGGPACHTTRSAGGS